MNCDISIEDKKEYLKSYRRICNKLNSLQQQKDSIIESMASAKAQTYNDMPRSNRQSDLSYYMVKLEKVLCEIDKATTECMNIKLEIESDIVKMKNGIECDVLRKRYLQLKPWESIGIELNYSMKQIFRIHGSALQHFEMNG